MLQRQVWILVHYANDIKLDFGATDLVLSVCCDVLFDYLGGVGDVDVGEEMGCGDGLMFLYQLDDHMSTVDRDWLILTLCLSSGTVILTRLTIVSLK